MKLILVLIFSMSCSQIVDFEDDINTDAGVDEVTAFCGNGIIEGFETCDGTALDTETCNSQGFSSGLLKCLDTCDEFETKYCYCETCGEDFCLDVQTNNNNCGFCGNACTGDTQCVDGLCVDAITCEDGIYSKYTREKGVDCWGNPTIENSFFCMWTCCEGTAVINMIAGESWGISEGNPEHCGGCDIQCKEEETCKQYDYSNPLMQFRCE